MNVERFQSLFQSTMDPDNAYEHLLKFFLNDTIGQQMFHIFISINIYHILTLLVLHAIHLILPFYSLA